MLRPMPLQVKVFPSIGSQQVNMVPLQSGVLPAETTTGIDMTSLMSMMIQMMIVVMMMKMMTSAMSSLG